MLRLSVRAGHCASLLLLVALLGACVLVPRTTTSFDEQCQVETHHMVLEERYVGPFVNCANQACGAELVAVGAVATASAVVSGSIALTGNVVYWVEKQGRCQR